MESHDNPYNVRLDRTIRQGVVKKRRRRMLRRVYAYARVLVACGLAFGLFRFWTSTIWEWNGQMSITGNRLVTKQVLLERINVMKHTPLYAISPSAISGQLEGIPAIARVAVRRWLFPPRLELSVIEREALVEILEESRPAERVNQEKSQDASKDDSAKDGNSASKSSPSPIDAQAGGDGDMCRWVDQEGVVFAAPRRLMRARFPILVHSNLLPGSRLPAKTQAHLFELLNDWPRGKSGRLDLRNPGDVYAAIGEWPIRFGEVDDIQLKFSMFQQLQPLAGKYKGKLKYINLRFPASPTFVLKTGAEVKPSGANPAPAEQDQPTSASPKPSPKATAH